MVSTSQVQAERIIHKEKSLYRNIVVRESSNRRCLVFAVKRGDRNQTCISLNDPDRVVFPYARMTFSGLLLQPKPDSILVIGLGGGTMPTVLSRLYPKATIHVAEIDEAVVRVATKYFNFSESENVRVFVQDARVYIKRAGLKKITYDLIILDAFTGDYIPEHLMTVEFLQETKAIMSDQGVLVANTFSTSRLYDHESVTYESAFGTFFNFKMPVTGNRVIITNGGQLPETKLMQDRANKLAGKLRKYAIKIDNFPRHMKRTKDWNKKARPLTDQFSPANLLRDD
jgi:spermidine synthase|tara:strand:+ start:1657 stop:2511 length:855 start_codon:yes stop_codon:yes gene_type:complete